MKIAMLTNNYKPFIGGVPISVERQAKHLANRGNEVTVFAPGYGQETEQIEQSEANVRVIRCKSGKKTLKNGMAYAKSIAPEIFREFKQQEFDCVHVHHPMVMGPQALYLGRKYKIPVIYTCHTRYEDYLHYIPFFSSPKEHGILQRHMYKLGREKVVPAYMRWFTNQCNLVLAPSQSIKNRLEAGGTKTCIAVLPTGLEETFYQQDEVKVGQIRKLYLQGRKHLFCTVCRLEKEKNSEFLLRGIAALKVRMKESFRVLIIGEGSQREALESMAESYRLSRELVFMGNVENEDIKHYIAASDLFLFASKTETQGIVLAEAFACGTPVVAVDATGVQDIVEHGKNGYTSSENVAEWAENIITAMRPQNMEQLSQYARQSALAFRACILASRQEMHYTQCITAKQNAKISSSEKEAGVWYTGGRKLKTPQASGDKKVFDPNSITV